MEDMVKVKVEVKVQGNLSGIAWSMLMMVYERDSDVWSRWKRWSEWKASIQLAKVYVARFIMSKE